MKKSSIYVLLLLTILNMACQKDLLNTVPNDRITSSIFWNQEKDAILASNAIYTFLDGTYLFAREALSDIAHTNKEYIIEASMEKGIYNPLTEPIENEWNGNYKGIRAANYFLENVDKVSTTNPDLINRLKGEIRVIRAYLYLKLFFIYGNVPLVIKSISIEEGQNIKQVPVNELSNFIGTELTEAAVLLPLTQTEKGRITKGAALALKARAMLFAKRYQEAADAAKEVMDLGVYDLYPKYEHLFSYASEDNSEVILDKQFLKYIYNNEIFYLLAPWSLTFDGGPLYVPLKKVVDNYQMKNGKNIDEAGSGFDPRSPYTDRDPRLQYSVFVPGSLLPNGQVFNPLPNSGTADEINKDYHASQTGFTIKKYINKEDMGDPVNCGINIILLRYAEVLLIYAEAKIELNQLDASVADAINKIRQRPDVNMPLLPAGLSQEQLRQAVRQERMAELAFEGQRFFDIRRWGIAEQVFNAPIYGMTYVDNNGQLQTARQESFVRNFNPARDYFWPIPQKEIDLNKNLEQNPGW